MEELVVAFLGTCVYHGAQGQTGFPGEKPLTIPHRPC